MTTYILGIESSCDDSSVAIINEKKEILAHSTYTQKIEHTPYGGVVPEIAARSHLNYLPELIKQALLEANINLNQLSAIAVTSGPGLIGGLIVGVVLAQSMANALNIPIIPINHLEGHALSPLITEDITFPYLLLLVSGGHTQCIIAHNIGKYEILGSTLDDALGEAFDKLAKMLNLGYPGGPMVEKLAATGDDNRYNFPLPLYKREGCDFSFSGLKTALKKTIDQQILLQQLDNQNIADICASFQKTILNILQDRLTNAFKEYEKIGVVKKNLVVSGGVAANQFLKNNITKFGLEHGYQVSFPPLKLCTDNGAMIAFTGLERFKLGYYEKQLKIIEPRARWPLSEL
jgi:N6-L-threonylcarbamoyladenine synthase